MLGLRLIVAVLAMAVLAWPPSPAAGQGTVPAPPVGGDCTGAVPRQEVRDLTRAQWNHYIDAVRTLQARATPETASAYDRLAFLHNKLASGGVIHQTAAFLPWHRAFVRSFEYELQKIDPTVSVPYWDWTRDSQRLAGAPFWNDSLFGLNGRGVSGVIRTGRFKDWIPFRSSFGKGQRDYGLVRQWFAPGLGTAPAAARIAKVLRNPTYGKFRSGLEFGGHGDVHIAIGGDMADFFSPNDPVFWLHHAFVDKLWDDWQSSAPAHRMAYAGPLPTRPDGAKLGDKLAGFGNLTVRDVMDPASLCVSYERSTAKQDSTTALRTSAETVRPGDKVTYVATLSTAEASGTVDFREAVGTGGRTRELCPDVQPRFDVNTWTATCETQLRGKPGLRRITASYGGDSRARASTGAVRQRVASSTPKVLWTPAASVSYGTTLGANVQAYASAPGQMRFTVSTAAAPETAATPETVLDAGYHVLRLRFTPRSGPPVTFTRSFVVTPGVLILYPENKRITTQDTAPELTYVIFGLAAGENPGSLTGFEQPICRAARPDDGLAENAPRPVGSYTIFCSGGSSLNYVFDTRATSTLEVVAPDDPRAGQPPEPITPALGAGPDRGRGRKKCTVFDKQIYCGAIKRRRHITEIVVERKGRVIARGRARRRGELLALEPTSRLEPGYYTLTLVRRGARERVLRIRIIPPAQARRASTGRSKSKLVCRLGDATLLGSRTRDGRRVSRWRIVQR